jgi:lincosamide and streptogramin A transport system ATP-binding/permease protein
MSSIILRDIDFHYHDPYSQVFEGLSLTIDTAWRTALVGRNGRGKSTLLRLLRRELQPVRGEITMPVATTYFPITPASPHGTTLQVIRDCVAPFESWEQRMQTLLERGDEESLNEYGELHERYESSGGYTIDARIEREIAEIGMPARVLEREFSTLSGGEQTRALIVALFLNTDRFPLIDEPTNHLDREGRRLLGNYLTGKPGFILVSHDRALLDLCADHIVSINRNDLRVLKGNYSDWKLQFDLEEECERRRNENLQREINTLETAARKRRSWSNAREKEKTSAPDSGFVSHRAARQMKRAIHIEERIEEKIEEKKGLLSNLERTGSLKIDVGRKSPEIVLSVERARIELDGRRIIDDFSLVVHRGDRIALVGPNGCGKTTLLRAIAGELPVARGVVHLPKHLHVSRAYQHPLWSSGSLRDHLREEALDETKFRNILGAFGLWGEIFDRPLETFSQGERKKVDLCRSFLAPGHLLIWDEPMNYIDLMSREQIEKVILEYQPTILFVEHDSRFIEKVATDVVELAAIGPQPLRAPII